MKHYTKYQDKATKIFHFLIQGIPLLEAEPPQPDGLSYLGNNEAIRFSLSLLHLSDSYFFVIPA